MALEIGSAVVIHLIGIEPSGPGSRLDGNRTDLSAEGFNVNADAEQEDRPIFSRIRLGRLSEKQDGQKK